MWENRVSRTLSGWRNQLTDQQLMTLALAVVIPLSILISVMIYSNNRINDLAKRIDKIDTDLSKKIDELKAHLDEKIDTAFEHMKLLLKLHEAEHHKS
jgi:hypothetical protein